MFATYAHAILLKPSGSLKKMKGSLHYLYFEATITKRLKVEGSKAFQRVFPLIFQNLFTPKYSSVFFFKNYALLLTGECRLCMSLSHCKRPETSSRVISSRHKFSSRLNTCQCVRHGVTYHIGTTSSLSLGPTSILLGLDIMI